ncbi:Rv3235 family protein [Nocardia mangyaensis]|uniref:Rv3235 family protein n=1 Tax=Nocardia mangyaensis TaxID=2213200 RepID=UPI00197D0620|nr:Rv3235 family protein [Nocardia mangyaensis]
MSTDHMTLRPAPHCEPQLESRAVTGGDRTQRPPLRRTDGHAGSAYRRPGGGAPAGVRRAVHGSCVAATPPVRPDSDTGARKFAEYALRLVLEVVDRRRSVSQLRTVVDPKVLSAMRTVLSQDLAPGRSLGTATLVRVHVSAAEPHAAEIFASYQRGTQTFAVAGRIERARDSWRLVAVRLG